jgi:putative HMW3
LKKGYIKLIAAIVLGAAIIGGGIYGVYTLLSSNTTTILYRSTVDDKINAIRPYIVALDAYNSYSVAYANQLQPTLEELRNGSHNTTITLPKYKELKAALEVAKQDSSTPYEDVNQATNDVLVVLDQIIPIADQLQSYYVERRYEKDNYKGSDELAAQYVPLAEQFYATYNALDLALDNRNNELYNERMTEYQGEKRENAVNFIEINLITAQTIDLIDPDGNTDTQKVESNLQQITQRLNKLQPGTTPEVQNAVREYQDSVKEFVAEARNYIIINSSYGEAYTQLFTKYNKMIGKANAVNMADLDVTEKK